MRRITLCIAIACLMTALATGESRAQDSATRQLRTMATEQMIDSRTDEALVDYAHEHLAPSFRESFADADALQEHLRAIRAAAGPIGGVGLMLAPGGAIELHITNYERRSVVALRLESESPHRIVELALVSSEEKEQGDAVGWENLEQTLEAAAAEGFSGSVLAIRDGEVVLDRGFGFADPGKTHPVTPQTLFAIGSTPIDFTHGAILKLWDMQKIDLDDSITRYFDGVPADKRGITLEMLRTSRSGLLDFPGIPGVDENLDLSWIDRDEFLRRVFAAELLFEPGSDRKHSHAAWGVLAAVVEIASGQTYEDFLRDHFFEPAQMARTGHYPLAKNFPASEIAVGLGGNTWGEINSPAHWGKTSWLVLGSGGMVSTTGDLHRWRSFLREDGVLSDGSLEKYGIHGMFMAEGGNDRGFINTIGANGRDLVILCSNSHVAMDDATAHLAMRVARLGTGE